MSLARAADAGRTPVYRATMRWWDSALGRHLKVSRGVPMSPVGCEEKVELVGEAILLEASHEVARLLRFKDKEPGFFGEKLGRARIAGPEPSHETWRAE
jgi:hypothetical protein